ncbi:MAG TPA: hypothetical protein VK526_00980, partial [Bradyrhizobium sp.]|nr:hypothetical protein [Bradyrhizobium sp.]
LFFRARYARIAGIPAHLLRALADSNRPAIGDREMFKNVNITATFVLIEHDRKPMIFKLTIGIMYTNMMITKNIQRLI